MRSWAYPWRSRCCRQFVADIGEQVSDISPGVVARKLNRGKEFERVSECWTSVAQYKSLYEAHGFN